MSAQLRFGVRALVQATGPRSTIGEGPADASWERNRRQILPAEELGYESTPLAQHVINPFGEQ